MKRKTIITWFVGALIGSSNTYAQFPMQNKTISGVVGNWVIGVRPDAGSLI